MLDAWVLIVDKSDEVLDELVSWISELPGFQVAGVARSAAEALVQIERTAPDIVLMDIALSDGNGLELTRRIKAGPSAPLIVLTTFHDTAVVRVAARTAGADACLTKHDLALEFPRVAAELWRKRHRQPDPPK